MTFAQPRDSDNEKPPLELFHEPRGGGCEVQPHVTIGGVTQPIDSPLTVAHHNGTVVVVWVVCPERLERYDHEAGCPSYPTFWAELFGASFVAPVVVSVGMRAPGRVYRVAWRSHDAGPHELSVRHWGDSAYFKGRSTCGKKRAPPGRPGKHVAGSPARLTFIKGNGFDDGRPLPLCGQNEVLNARARWLRDSGRDSGVFAPRSLSSGPFEYAWTPVGCRLRDFAPRSLIDELLGPQSGPLNLHFIGESTIYYLCLALAGALSNHTQEHLHSKFSRQAKIEGVRKVLQTELAVGKARLHCYSTIRATHPRGQAEVLREIVAHQSPDSALRKSIFVVGDCGAYSACPSDGASREARGRDDFASRRVTATDGTRELILQAGRAVDGGYASSVVWIAPAFTRKSYMQLVRRMHGDQLALWRHALSEHAGSSLLAVDQRPMSRYMHPRFAFDGLHYHSVSKRSSDGAEVFYGGPVLFTSLRLMFNALLNHRMTST